MDDIDRIKPFVVACSELGHFGPWCHRPPPLVGLLALGQHVNSSP
uniref:Uncharacterized protein n=1 Tax=Arundo donax TaxID=35708 RepID=A0A0A9TFF6_ARUDO